MMIEPASRRGRRSMIRRRGADGASADGGARREAGLGEEDV